MALEQLLHIWQRFLQSADLSLLALVGKCAAKVGVFHFVKFVKLLLSLHVLIFYTLSFLELNSNRNAMIYFGPG